eukprot:XP_001689696.1 predicted protein [Chlamydomonas reinhardtii]
MPCASSTVEATPLLSASSRTLACVGSGAGPSRLAATANADVSSLVQLALQQWDAQGRGLPSLLGFGSGSASPSRAANSSPSGQRRHSPEAPVPRHLDTHEETRALAINDARPSTPGATEITAARLNPEASSLGDRAGYGPAGTGLQEEASLGSLGDYLWDSSAAVAAAGAAVSTKPVAIAAAGGGAGGVVVSAERAAASDGGSGPPSPAAFFHSAGSSAASPTSSRRSSFAAEGACGYAGTGAEAGAGDSADGKAAVGWSPPSSHLQPLDGVGALAAAAGYTRVERPEATVPGVGCSGPEHSLATRFAAARGLLLHHRRIERLIMPNTSTFGSSGLLEMPPVVVDDAPPLAQALQLAVAPLGRRLRRLHVTSEPGPVTDLDLDLLTVMAPELQELVVRFDVHETPAPELQGLSQLSDLRRLALQLSSAKLNYDPAPERLVRSLQGLTGLRALSLDLTAAELPLPGRQLAGLTSLRLAVVWRGYSASQGGGQSEQLRGLVSALAQLTALKALAVPDGYRGADGDLLRAAAPVLPSLTALHLPRLSATRPELQALERLPMLQHVTLGSVDVAPDEDYEGLDLPRRRAGSRRRALAAPPLRVRWSQGRLQALEASLRWGGLAALLAHLHPAAMERALAQLQHVRDLELAGGLSGAPPAASPTLLLQLAAALAALPALRRLRLSAAAPNTDALVQGLPGLLVALRRPLRLEAAFLSHSDAAQLRQLLDRLAEPSIRPRLTTCVNWNLIDAHSAAQSAAQVLFKPTKC